MLVLTLGVITFFGIHLLPALPQKQLLVSQLGEAKYKIGFSLVSLSGLGLIIWGFQLAEFVPLWTPPPFGRALAMSLMPFAIILLCAADAPNNIKRFVRHPMLIGITLWAGVHLAANGDLASTIIFASFLVFSLFDILAVELSGRYKTREAVSPLWDVAVVVAGLALFAVLYYFHGSFTGMPLR
jgi:uncharacterized membrane protein